MILNLRNVGMNHREAREGDIKTSIADIKLARKVLGFRARISLSKGISELWKDEYPLHI
jgi:UDP-glucose 4-epimerase